jgi:acyl-CoA reductase-like NAD-dependent aldehyde dehydrogenase
MVTVPHLPLLRFGEPYESVDVARLSHVATGEPVAEVSHANPGLVARDLVGRAGAAQRALGRLPAAELAAICRRAADLFAGAELPAGDTALGPERFVRCQSATTGMPETLCRANMTKIETVLGGVEAIIAGLSRGLDLEAIDRGFTTGAGGRPLAYRRETDLLGAVLPSNSPGVHGLWIPALALKVALALKPGAREPWTPLRVAAALAAAGCPPEAIGFYPGPHAVGTEILLGAGRSLLFGDRDTVGGWADDPRVELHGPGWSKVVVGADRLDRWPEHLELIVTSVAANGGRSCVNASGVWLPVGSPGRPEAGRTSAPALAEALARRLAAIEPRQLDDPEAALAAFPDPATARRISEWIDRRLARPGAVDVTARHRGGAGRVAEAGGCTFLRPTVIHVTDPDHPLAQAELLFPFVAVVEAPAAELVERLGPSLAVTALTEDPELIAALLAARHVDRLHLGPVPTCDVAWDQPHEGNLFDLLYRRRGLRGAVPAAATAAAAPTRSPAAGAERSGTA